MRSARARALRATAPLVALILATSAPALAQEPRASLPDVEDEVMCPICGTPLEHSNAPQAERERELIRRLIDEGRDKEEIKDALVAEYGPEVLAVPEGEGFDLLAWLVPGLAIAAAAGALAFLALRQLRRPPAPPAVPSVDAREGSRLDEDMSRYDL